MCIIFPPEMIVKEALEFQIFSSEVEAPIVAHGKEEYPLVKKKSLERVSFISLKWGKPLGEGLVVFLRYVCGPYVYGRNA